MPLPPSGKTPRPLHQVGAFAFCVSILRALFAAILLRLNGLKRIESKLDALDAKQDTAMANATDQYRALVNQIKAATDATGARLTAVLAALATAQTNGDAPDPALISELTAIRDQLVAMGTGNPTDPIAGAVNTPVADPSAPTDPAPASP